MFVALALTVTATLVLALGPGSSEPTSPGSADPADAGTAPSDAPPGDARLDHRGFSSLAIGAGGFVTGISFSDDGRTRVVRTDGFGGYRWSAAQDRWVLDVSSESLPTADVEPGLGGGVLAVAVAPSDSSVVYMAFDNGVFRSEDGATTWDRVLDGVSTAPNDDFRTTGSRLVVDPVDSDTVYYGSQLDGLYLSRDGGGSWSRVSRSDVPAGLLVDIEDKQASGDVSRPTDLETAGSRLGGGGVGSIAVDRSGPVVGGRSQVLYAASYGEGVYRSDDGGSSWSSIGVREIGAVGYLRVLDNGDVVATAHRDPTDLKGPAQVWRYRGGVWSDITPPEQEEAWRAVAADPLRPGGVAVMAPGGRLAVSSDYGDTWSVLSRTQSSTGDVGWLAWALNEGETSYMSVGELAFDPVVKGRLWLTEGTGVWYADLADGSAQVQWQSQARGIEQLVPTDVVAPPGGKPLVTAWDRPIFRSEDPESYPVTYGPTNGFGSAWSIDYSVSDPSYVVASVASHQYPSDPSDSGYSTDGGRTWTPFPSIPEGSTNAVTTFGFGAIAVGDPGNVVWAPAFGKRPVFTQDGGRTWSPVELPGLSDYALVDNKPYYVNRQVLTADKTTPGTFYLYVMSSGTYRSTDGGATWTQMSDNAAMDGTDYGYAATLKSVPAEEGELYLTPGLLGDSTDQAFLHSRDAGATWEQVEGMTGVTAFGFGRAFPGSDASTIFAAGYLDGRYGLYRSTDAGTSWTYLVDYPDGRTPSVVAIDGDKDIVGRLYAAVGGSGWVFGDTR